MSTDSDPFVTISESEPPDPECVEALVRLSDGGREQVTSLPDLVAALRSEVRGLPGSWAIEFRLEHLAAASRQKQFDGPTVARVATALREIDEMLEQEAARGGNRGAGAREILLRARDELEWVEAAVRLLNG